MKNKHDKGGHKYLWARMRQKNRLALPQTNKTYVKKKKGKEGTYMGPANKGVTGKKKKQEKRLENGERQRANWGFVTRGGGRREDTEGQSGRISCGRRGTYSGKERKTEYRGGVKSGEGGEWFPDLKKGKKRDRESKNGEGGQKTGFC